MPASDRAARLVTLARYRAKKKNQPIDLDVEDIRARLAAGRCEATGIPFEESGVWSASLDRKDPDAGYTKANTQIVVWAYNVMKNTWGDLTILRVAEARRLYVQQPSERNHEDTDRRSGDGRLPRAADPRLDNPAG